MRNLSESKPGDIRRQSRPEGDRKIMFVGACPKREASYWVPWEEGRKPLKNPVSCEPQNLMAERAAGTAPADCFTLYNAPPYADHKEVYPEEEDLAQDVRDWATHPQRKALLEGRRVFSIKETGDPYSTHYEATEIHTTGFIYCGNFPHLGKSALENHIRRHHPGCLVGREN